MLYPLILNFQCRVAIHKLILLLSMLECLLMIQAFKEVNLIILMDALPEDLWLMMLLYNWHWVVTLIVRERSLPTSFLVTAFLRRV
jgi:hypothetical protein